MSDREGRKACGRGVKPDDNGAECIDIVVLLAVLSDTAGHIQGIEPYVGSYVVSIGIKNGRPVRAAHLLFGGFVLP